MNKMLLVIIGCLSIVFNAAAYQRNETYSDKGWTWVSETRIAVASSNIINGTRAVIGFDIVDNGAGVVTSQFVYFNDVPFTECDRVQGKHSKDFSIQGRLIRLSELCYPGSESVYTDANRRDYDTLLTQLLGNSEVTINGFRFKTRGFESEISKMSYMVAQFNQ